MKQERILRGTAVSPGVAIGTALKLDRFTAVVLRRHIPSDRVEDEVRRFERALAASREQLEKLKTRLDAMVGPEHSYILDAHILMLEDRSLVSEILGNIRGSRANAEWAVRKATDRIRRAYAALEDRYFGERGSEIESVVERILLNLAGERDEASLPEDVIVVARDFAPSSFARIDPRKIRALALESGGRASHTAIIARSLRVPAVMEIAHHLMVEVSSGDTVLVDGDAGEIVVNPGPARAEAGGARMRAALSRRNDAPAAPELPLRTADGTPISLRANLELPHEVREARRFGAEGIGLFRSEFLFFAHPQGAPSVEEQVETYRMLLDEIRPHPVAIRTLDAEPERRRERSEGRGWPVAPMGRRGIRLSLGSPHGRELFAAQVEAVLRASAYGPAELVLPMVTSVEEVREARRVIDGARARIERNDGPLPWTPSLGIMIEVPAAVMILPLLSREADFLCVGTNDLIQYTLAVDRDDAEVSRLFQPLHPAVVQSLGRVAQTAAALGSSVRVCGEVAANPFYAVLLAGLGYRQLSMNPYAIPQIRSVLHAITIQRAVELAERALALGSAEEIGELLVEGVSASVPIDLAASVGELRDGFEVRAV